MLVAVRFELVRRWRPSTVFRVGVATAVLAAVASVLVVALAPDTAPDPTAVTAARLADVDGATVALRVLSSFAGLAVLVLVTVSVSTDAARGTLRTTLLHHPGRAILFTAKLLATVLTFAAVLLAAEIVSWGASWAAARANDIDTSAWITAQGLRATVADFGRVLAGTAAWTAIATAIGVVVPSTAVAVGALLVWAGPFEHLVGEAWDTARHWFPELLIETLVAGGTPDVGVVRAAALSAAYAIVAVAVAVAVFVRRDITT